jgi:hypothetical protein
MHNTNHINNNNNNDDNKNYNNNNNNYNTNNNKNTNNMNVDNDNNSNDKFVVVLVCTGVLRKTMRPGGSVESCSLRYDACVPLPITDNVNMLSNLVGFLVVSLCVCLQLTNNYL